MKKPRPKKCKSCGEPFQPFNSLQKACSSKCALDLALKTKAKKAARDHRDAKKVFRDKDRALQLTLAQAQFNKWIRLRDEEAPCISCGRLHTGQYHAGHYRSVGAMQALRFCPENVHKQCSPCNNHKSGNITEYRINLVKKIGAEKVEWLEGPHAPQKWTVEEIIAIKKKYAAKCKELLDKPDL